MLREFKAVRQEPGGRRRWFESDGFDLIIWLNADGAAEGFQICYDFGRGEHALTYRSGEGCTHHAVDGGDEGVQSDQTPILVRDGAVPWPQLLEAFDARCGTLEPALRELVRGTLARGEAAAQRGRH